MTKNRKVLERILSRKDKKNDDYKIGLIFEGGGMRGAFSAGCAFGLEQLGLRDCFDYIYSSSSGSCAGAFLLSGDSVKGAKTYYEDLSGFRFIKPWKINKIMDIDYLCDDIFVNKRTLNKKNLKKTKTTLKVYVCDAETGKPYCFTNHDDIDIISLIKASCALPVFYNRHVELNGDKLVDGNMAKRMPIEEAITDGCTDILVVTTVPEKFREKNNPIVLLLQSPFLKHFDPNFIKAYKTRKEDYNEGLDTVFGKKPIHRKVNIYTISPDKLYFLGEIRAKKLKSIVESGASKVKEAFGG